MSEDRRRPSQYPSRRDESLRRWIRDEVHPFSRPLQPALEKAGLGRRGVRAAADLDRLPVVTFDDLGDGRDWVLDPTPERVRHAAGPATRARLAVADVLGIGADRVRSALTERFKPVGWTLVHGPRGPLFTAASTADLRRLGGLGRRALSVSGVRPDDRVLVATSWADGIGRWQAELGCLDAGVAVLRHGATPSTLLAGEPTVVAGDLATLDGLDPGLLPDTVRMVVLVESRLSDDAVVHRLGDDLGRPVRRWWSPQGTRAAWARCPGGEGFHTWPVDEVVEVVDDAGRPAPTGRIVWSPVGWRGSVWLRLDLGISGRLDPEPCRACRRTTPRLVPTLDTDTGVDRRAPVDARRGAPK